MKRVLVLFLSLMLSSCAIAHDRYIPHEVTKTENPLTMKGEYGFYPHRIKPYTVEEKAFFTITEYIDVYVDNVSKKDIIDLTSFVNAEGDLILTFKLKEAQAESMIHRLFAESEFINGSWTISADSKTKEVQFWVSAVGLAASEYGFILGKFLAKQIEYMK